VDLSAGRQGLVLRVEMDIGTGVELEYSYGAGDGRTRSGVASMPKERSGGPRLDRSCDWEKYGYDTTPQYQKMQCSRTSHCAQETTILHQVSSFSLECLVLLHQLNHLFNDTAALITNRINGQINHWLGCTAVKSGSTPVRGPVKSGRKRTKEEDRGLDKRLVRPELVTAWIQ